MASADTGIVIRPDADAVASAATPSTATCVAASAPMPSSLPASNCTGRTDESTSSTTRLDFSSTTPIATQVQNMISWVNRATTVMIAIAWRCELPDDSVLSTRSGAARSAFSIWRW